MNCCILCCSSMKPFLDAAQIKENTNWPVIEIDRLFHSDPAKMKEKASELLNGIPKEFDTILVGMAFCGGVWDHVAFNRRIVIPRFDDCVSILLTVDNSYCPNRKEPGHLYLYENNPQEFMSFALLRDHADTEQDYAGMDKDFLFHMWFDSYKHLDIIDTGFNDCYSEEYAAAAQAKADQIDADLDYVGGSNLVWEKLVGGRWDEQFLIAEPGHLLRHADFF